MNYRTEAIHSVAAIFRDFVALNLDTAWPSESQIHTGRKMNLADNPCKQDWIEYVYQRLSNSVRERVASQFEVQQVRFQLPKYLWRQGIDEDNDRFVFFESVKFISDVWRVSENR